MVEIKAGKVGYGLLIERDAGHIIGDGDTVSQIKEDIGTGKKFVIPDNFIVSAVFQKYGIKNANGRVYPENVLKREVQKYLENQVARHSSVGALDHPSYSSLSGHDVAHRILDLRWEGHTLVGEMKLHLSEGFKRYGMCSTSGDLVANMILDGINVGVSSRGVGGVVEKMGVFYVDDTYDLVGWDDVLEPSTNNAWISTDPRDLKPYIESLDKCNGITIAEKINKIGKILNL
ncbi:MAG: hypothetical protein J6Y37_05740 [Paludibacteraceae bacterium]|nr:hypothetical protein [Paludibacteraceae bacterium]